MPSPTMISGRQNCNPCLCRRPSGSLKWLTTSSTACSPRSHPTNGTATCAPGCAVPPGTTSKNTPNRFATGAQHSNSRVWQDRDGVGQGRNQPRPDITPDLFVVLYCAVQPQSMVRALPVMPLASLEQRYAAIFAISFGSDRKS